MLIFVSLAEHYVRIVADDGIAAKVDQSVWQGAVDVLLLHIRHGDMAAGFISAVEQCGEVLAEHFPRKRRRGRAAGQDLCNLGAARIGEPGRFCRRRLPPIAGSARKRRQLPQAG